MDSVQLHQVLSCDKNKAKLKRLAEFGPGRHELPANSPGLTALAVRALEFRNRDDWFDRLSPGQSIYGPVKFEARFFINTEEQQNDLYALVFSRKSS